MKKYVTLALFICVACAGKGQKPKSMAQAPKPVEVVTAPVVTPTPLATPVVELSNEAPNQIEDAPTKVIQNYTEELKKIVDPTSAKNGVKRDRRKEQKIAEKVRQFFDFEGLARASLGDQWGGATPQQRKEYMDLFVALIEDSYLRRTRDIVGEYKIVYEKEEVKTTESKVFSRVVRNDADVDIQYSLHRNPQKWMIYNINLDGVDLVRNYQTQFNRIIQQSNFNGLLDRLRKKRDELNKDDTTP